MDKHDKAFVDSLVPDGAVVTSLVAAVAWVNEDGSQSWRCYCDSDATVMTTLGLLELAKLDVVARSDTGLPLAYDDLED